VPFCRIEAGHFLKRVAFRTDVVKFLEHPGQPVGDMGTRRTTSS